MPALSNTADLVAAMQHAHSIALRAYVLRPGTVLDALSASSRRGARVRVRLECRPFADPSGALAAQNASAVATLASAGADAALADCDGLHPAHIKDARVDGALFLDDRNWPDDGGDTILRADPADDVALQKDDALRREARTIYRAADAGKSVAVETESFGFGRVYAALKFAAARGPVRLLVTARDVTARSLPALRRLQAAGVTVRTCAADEKLAVTPDEAWAGSANATAGVPAQADWGLRIFQRPVVNALRARFERNWSSGVPL